MLVAFFNVTAFRASHSKIAAASTDCAAAAVGAIAPRRMHGPGGDAGHVCIVCLLEESLAVCLVVLESASGHGRPLCELKYQSTRPAALGFLAHDDNCVMPHNHACRAQHRAHKHGTLQVASSFCALRESLDSLLVGLLRSESAKSAICLEFVRVCTMHGNARSLLLKLLAPAASLTRFTCDLPKAARQVSQSPVIGG